MKDLIIQYAKNPESAKTNFELALEYDRLGQTAAAISFYLRAADRANLDEPNLNDFEMRDLAYRAMVKIALAFDKQQNRGFTVQGALKHAIRICSWRPEAYYHLSRYYEVNKRFVDSYMTANQGLNAHSVTNANPDLNYPGKYGLLFQSAVAAWWWGKPDETRHTMKLLADFYRDEMDEVHMQAVQNNLSTLGLSREAQAVRRYDSSKHDLKFKFDGLYDIDKNYAQAFQDMFVLSVLNGKVNGTYLEIGSADSFHNNNTALLEQKFNWTGIGIDYNANAVADHNANRKNPCIHVDATKANYESLLKTIAKDGIVDYLQLDCEPAKVTFDALLSIPFDKYKFRTITYEHDYYADVTRSYREKSRRYLSSLGYVLVVPNVSVDGVSVFEDWYVHGDLVDMDRVRKMMVPEDTNTNIEQYFTNPKWYAEFGTDKYIRKNFFPNYDYKGTFVDVGAGPPNFISNSCHFRNNGWRTICVEPNPKFVEQHEKQKSECYQFACADFHGRTEFTVNLNQDNWYTKENDGVSFSAIDIRYDNVPEHNKQEKIKVDVMPLDSILEVADCYIPINTIDVLSIDTEGWELDVLRGFDVEKYKPKVIVIENFQNDPKYDEYMNGIGYVLNQKLGYNHIYIRAK